MVVLSVSFLVAIASAGITAASSILDRRQTYGLLRLAGTPLTVLDTAPAGPRRWIPLAVHGRRSIVGLSAGGSWAARRGGGLTCSCCVGTADRARRPD